MIPQVACPARWYLYSSPHVPFQYKNLSEVCYLPVILCDGFSRQNTLEQGGTKRSTSATCYVVKRTNIQHKLLNLAPLPAGKYVIMSSPLSCNKLNCRSSSGKIRMFWGLLVFWLWGFFASFASQPSSDGVMHPIKRKPKNK